MVMDSVCFFFFPFPSTFSITLPHSSSSSSTLQYTTSTSTSTSLPHFHLRASSPSSSSSSSSSDTNYTTRTTRRRRSRRVKTDAEICHDIWQFLASVGLPEHHVPSTKELLLRGRNDLANIVRRRGHKQIEALLTSSLNANIDSLNMEQSCDERPVVADDSESLLTGQNVKVESLVDDFTALTEVCLGNKSSSLDTYSTLYLDECTSFPIELSANFTVDNGLGDHIEEVDHVVGEPKDHGEDVNQAVEEDFYPTEGAVMDNDCSSSSEDLNANFENQSSIMPLEISGEPSFKTKYSGNLECEDNLVGKMVEDITLPSVVPSMENHYNTSFNDSAFDTEDKGFSPLASSKNLSMEQKDWNELEALDDSNNNIAEDAPSTSEVSIMANLSGENKVDSVAHSSDSNSINLDSLANLSLEEKVANFIQNGDLDLVEDGDDSQESKVNIESEPVVDMPLSTRPPKDNNVMSLKGSSLETKHLVPSGTLDQLPRDDHMQHMDLTTHSDKDLDAEVPKGQNQSEINYLKFMLYQKELELSRLKEQIEKEKLALSVLQTKAEAEINKARKLIFEKDAELHDAEESLSGLKEVEVEFAGDGDVVEVAGSFNGWHHRIKMDPQPSTSAIDFGGSRRSRFWSTTLWLYPGVYEIKFVVDGHWRVDSQRESVTRGHICNNILRVDR